ncbi:hypothetical protein ElyMa_004569000 [Elysia marginata]|uniref:Uncharacterized protein n=1 Tax=Elysia marginata TaxID=1093978 RepID=A0AAV4HTM6_9GAST|nr:hypothetical protein ElyMa_004569000 [Elysia marginata]
MSSKLREVLSSLIFPGVCAANWKRFLLPPPRFRSSSVGRRQRRHKFKDRKLWLCLGLQRLILQQARVNRKTLTETGVASGSLQQTRQADSLVELPQAPDWFSYSAGNPGERESAVAEVCEKLAESVRSFNCQFIGE